MDEAAIRRIMPNNLEAEQAIIGSMLMDQSAIMLASEKLSENDFYNTRYKIMFRVITALYNEGTPSDLVTVTAKLREEQVPEELASIEFISDTISSVPTAANVAYYIGIVLEKSMLRNLIRTTEGITNQCYQESADAMSLMENTEKSIFELIQKKNGSEDFIPIKDIALEALDNIQRAAMTTGSLTGLSTGFTDLDYRTAGLQPSDLILIAARPSMGKTAFALNIAENAAMKHNTPTAIFSLEMSKIQLAKRLISMNSRVDAQNLRTGNLNDDEWASITESSIVLGESSLFIDDTPGITVNELRTKCRKLSIELEQKQGAALGLVIIDYLQLMNSSTDQKNVSRQQQISDISRALKALARELNCPLVALSQLSREVEKREDKHPILSDLRDSGAIEQDADVVMFLYRDEYYTKDASTEKNIAEVIIGKQRNGPTCTVKLHWDGKYTKFANLQNRKD